MANNFGRISGQLLKENLTRNGNDLQFDTDLLFLNVNSRYIGVNSDTPFRPLLVDGTTTTTNLVATGFSNPNLIISTDHITSDGNINLSAATRVYADSITTDDIEINDNTISTITPATNLELRPNGNGTVNINSNFNITGKLWAKDIGPGTGNITIAGNIIFGDDQTEDTVSFAADINSDIIPSRNQFYSLGANPLTGNRWLEISPVLINGQTIDTGALSVGGVDLGLRPGKIWYVSVNGSNSSVGNHAQAPFLTIKHALLGAQPGDEVFIFPGTYAEIFPLTVPVGVSVKGTGIRSVSVVPTVGTNTNNAFLLNGETTVCDLTVKDFYAPGYAFSFAPGFTVSSRSPYVQNISVITTGSITSPSDPRGFDEGDAGGGAYIDGSLATSSSNEASMLFHSVTFICPGVDALVMTNGVRVEWLNSFTYFANKGMYATNGTLGLASLGVRFGAEIRSIGSANVYGNYGAYAVGSGTLMYLINHNFGYIGSGKDFSNDSTLVIQANEVVELDSGKIYYQGYNKGMWRVGNAFSVNHETGNVTFNGVSVSAGGISEINFANDDSDTHINSQYVSSGNIKFSGNTISSLFGPINLLANTDELNIPHDAAMAQNLGVDGDFSVDGTLTIGNQIVDRVQFSADVVYDLRPDVNNTHSLGSITNNWLEVYVRELNIGTSLKVSGHTIETLVSGTDLRLEPNNLGIVSVPSNNVLITNDLTVNTDTNLFTTSITGTVELTGDITRTGNTIQTGNIDLTGHSTISSTAKFANIQIDANTVTTMTGSANLELLAASSGTVYIPSNNVQVDQNLTVDDTIQVGSITVHGVSTATTFNTGDINIYSNTIKTTIDDHDLELGAAGTGIVLVDFDNTQFAQDLTVDGTTALKNTVIGTGTAITQVSQNVSGTSSPTGFFFYGWQILTPGQTVSTFSAIQPGWTVVGQPTWVVSVVGDGISNYDITITGGVFASGGTYSFTGPLPSNITHVGDYLQTGSTLQTGNRSISSTLDVDSSAYFDSMSFVNNTITTTDTDTDLSLKAAGSGLVVFDENTTFSQSLTVDTLVGNGITNSGTTTTGTLFDNDIEINSNVITTTVGNNDLRLLAAGAGIISIPLDPVLIDNDLTVGLGSTLKNTSITGNLLHTGNTTQTGNVLQTGDLEISNDLTVTGTNAFFTDIRIVNNSIATSIGNNDLRLLAAGSGIININDNATFNQNLRVNGIVYTNGITNSGTITSDIFTDNDIEINDNYITTTVGNNNLILTGNGTGGPILEKIKFNSNVISTESNSDNITLTIPSGSVTISAATALKVPTGTGLDRPTLIQGDLRFNTTDVSFNGFSTAKVTLGGVSSADLRTKVTAHPTNNTLTFTTNNLTALTVSSAGFVLNRLTVDNNLTFTSNTISTTATNEDLYLTPDGSGQVQMDAVAIIADEILNLNSSGALILQNTGAGYVSFGGTGALGIPAGPTVVDTTGIERGDLRFNTDLSIVEIFNGTSYEGLSGTTGGLLNAEEVQEITNLWALVLG